MLERFIYLTLNRLTLALVQMRILKFNTVRYWNQRYGRGGDSGAGSKGNLARFKADYLNRFVTEHDVKKVIEWGCGDGMQLASAVYPQYVGLDISKVVLHKVIKKFKSDKSKEFRIYNPEYIGTDPAVKGDLALSLDVVYHIINEKHFINYLFSLFNSSERFVIIYAPDIDRWDDPTKHERYRRFTPYVEKLFPSWKLIEIKKNKYSVERNNYLSDRSESDFYVYKLNNI